MSTYTHLIDDIVRSVKDTPFVFDLIDDPIRISADDIFDVTSFTEDLIETFEKLSLCVNPQDIIQIDDPISGEPLPDSWDSDEDDEELWAIGNGTQQLNCKPSNQGPNRLPRILYDPKIGSGRILPISNKQWEPIERPQTPLEFQDHDIEYPPSPTTPPPPPYRESFDNFITNGSLKENGRFMGKIPIPLQFLISIKVKEAIRMYQRSLKTHGFETIHKKPKKRVMKKHIICKHGSACVHHNRPGGCIFAHSLDEWCPIACRHGDHCWHFGKQSGFKNTCRHFHPEAETKAQYYKRQKK